MSRFNCDKCRRRPSPPAALPNAGRGEQSGNVGEPSRRGLTLLELVIVLIILAALTTVAVRSLGPVADQARYEKSQRLLEELDRSYQLRSIEAGGVVSYSGFIADIGRLPIAIGDDPETHLSELWDPTLLPPFAITPVDDPDTADSEQIPVAAGWKGPYLLLPPGPATLRDGFGNALLHLNGLGFPVSDGEEIAGLVSLGSNGLLDPTDVDYARDLTLPGGIWAEGRFTGTVPFYVITSDGLDPELNSGETLHVRLYGPIDGQAGRISSEEVAANASLQYEGSVTATCGPRVIMAVVTTGETPNEEVERASMPYQIVVSPGMNPTRELVIPPDP